MPSGAAFENLPGPLEEAFREIWTLHADCISVLYSGTGALKTDFTRTGKRTKAGALEDGRRSVTRYFLNNFSDPYKQNSLDLTLGKISVNSLPGLKGDEGKSAFVMIICLMFLPLIGSKFLFNTFDKSLSFSLCIVI